MQIHISTNEFRYHGNKFSDIGDWVHVPIHGASSIEVIPPYFRERPKHDLVGWLLQRGRGEGLSLALGSKSQMFENCHARYLYQS